MHQASPLSSHRIQPVDPAAVQQSQISSYGPGKIRPLKYEEKKPKVGNLPPLRNILGYKRGHESSASSSNPSSKQNSGHSSASKTQMIEGVLGVQGSSIELLERPL